MIFAITVELFQGKICDIDKDGSDDNLPFGPWIYNVNATTPLLAHSRLTSNQQTLYSSLLYDKVLQNTFFSPPGYIPWQSYQANPSVYKKIDNFLPSQDYSSEVYFADADLINTDIGQWIDQVTPNSPTQKFFLPRNSYSINQNTQALYGEYNYASDVWPLLINAGIRWVQTDMEVSYSKINNAPKISLTNQSWPISGIGNGWSIANQNTRYNNVLPSVNFIWTLSDNKKLRLSAGKSIAQPNFQLLGKGSTPSYRTEYIKTDIGTENERSRPTAIAIGGMSGNPDLTPEEITQGDISFESYYGLSSYLQLALFYKQINGEIIEGIRVVDMPDESINGSTRVNIITPTNSRQSHIKGLEIALQNTWASGFGININYSFLDSQSELSSYSKNQYAIPGTSQHMLNTAGFFESPNFSIRLAYSWRSEYVSPYQTSITAINRTISPDIEEPTLVRSYLPFGQWDARITWHSTANMTMTLDALNIDAKESSSYLEYEENINSNLLVEPRYVIGIKMSF
jgi:iron complex outermembrane recepter protein